ncbi:MAG: transposase, partial [Crenarchaeota archaeon]|nr:transposase [Thermoproteota archaeon]
MSHIERKCVLELIPRFEALCNLWARGYPTYPPDVSRTIVNKVAFFIDKSWLGTRPKKWFCRIKVPLDIQVRIGNERDRGAPIFIDLKKRELRLRRFIPRKAIVLKLDKSHVRYIIERLREGARAKCGFVWVEDRYLCVSIVFEREEPRPYTPESILIIDVNSWKHGIMTALVKNGHICSIRRYRPDLHRIETWYNKTLLLEKELGKLKRLGLEHSVKARRVRLEAKNLRRKIYAYL